MTRFRSSALSLLLACSGVAVAAPSAPAATVGLGQFDSELRIEAATGETNDIDVRRGAERTIVVEDGGSPLIAGRGCEPFGAAVRCSIGDIYLIWVELGDGADRLTTTGNLPVQVTGYGEDGNDVFDVGGVGDVCLDGGGGDDSISISIPSRSCSISGDAGNDRLQGSTGQDRLYGGEGDDQLDAGAGPDYAEGDEGNDSITGGAGGDIFLEGGDGADRIDGGAGGDFMEDGRGEDEFVGGSGNDALAVLTSAGVASDTFLGGTGVDGLYWLCGGCRVQLGTARNGHLRTPERDLVEAENVVIRSLVPNDEELPPEIYGSGADIVTGDGSANALRTERGPDRLAGGGGPDRLVSGPGDDLIRSADGRRDSLVDCGEDQDRAIVDRFDRPRNCETVRVVGG